MNNVNSNKQSVDKKPTTPSKKQDESDGIKQNIEDEPEKQIGLFQTASTRSYLEQTVSEVVMQGMSELARVRPDNPLEYLGNFILSKAKNK
jgi:hypothetical protein